MSDPEWLAQALGRVWGSTHRGMVVWEAAAELPDVRLVAANPSARRMFRLREFSIPIDHRALLTMQDPLASVASADTLRAVGAGGVMGDYNVRLPGAIGERRELAVQLEMLDEARVFMVMSDVTSEYTERRSASRTAADLERAIQTISHDLASPLRHISGFTKLAMDRLAAALKPGVDATQVQAWMGEVRAATERMQRRLSALSRFGKASMHELTDHVDIAAITNEALAEVMTEISGQLPEVSVVGTAPLVLGHRDALLSVMQNLLQNAVKYRKRGTTLRITVEFRQSTDFLVVEVRDNGQGFDDKFRDRIFELGFRATAGSEAAGDGIGLAIVRRVIDRHGGSVWAQSKVGVGSTFAFTLPLLPTSSSSGSHRPPAAGGG